MGTNGTRGDGRSGQEQPLVDVSEHAWREVRADESGVLIDAADYYRAFYEAAEGARRYMLLSGWQFDSKVPILRGADASSGKEVRLLPFLSGLCDRRPELEIFILAWDFHLVFALEREWMQKMLFSWKTNERLRFRFDESEADQGSHHQKFVVVDGVLGFVGGIDLSESRWDDRCHRAENPLRRTRRTPAKPYHDTQAYLVGTEPAKALRDLFAERWSRTSGRRIPIPVGPTSQTAALRFHRGLPLGAARVALSRTDPKGQGATVREVEGLFVAAIEAAQELIYIETQYFSSTRVCQALLSRMVRRRPRLQLVLILNKQAEALKEEIAVGLRQAKNLSRLRAAASRSGHALGIYYSLSEGEGDDRRATYIHSKLMIVDDRFLTVGSANLTNRSMGVDSELHVSWQATSSSSDRALGRAIRRLRVSLLAEHTGRRGVGQIARLADREDLVASLDGLTQTGGRLRAIGGPSPGQEVVLSALDPERLPFDPSEPTYDEGEGERADEPSDWSQDHPGPSLIARAWHRIFH